VIPVMWWNERLDELHLTNAKNEEEEKGIPL
jgi:hypothetical protein